MKPSYKTWLFGVLIVEGIVIIVMLLFGFRIMYAPELDNSWAAISGVAEWVSALAAVAVPVAVVYLQSLIDRNKKDISGANVDLLREVEEMKRDFEVRLAVACRQDMENKAVEPNEDQIREQQKKKALKYINISMMAHTQAVADELGISKEDAHKILVEMLLHDQLISCAGQWHIENIDGVLWTRKSNK